jgi:hypothetical protein
MLDNLFEGLEKVKTKPKKKAKRQISHRSSQASLMKDSRTEERDIGKIPEVKNPERRAKGKRSFSYFCKTYNPNAFYFEFSEDHLEAIKRIEQCVLFGLLFAFAMPRGSGKSTLCKMAVLWAALYAHRFYIYLIAATGEKAKDLMRDIKVFLELPLIQEDFPEVAYPIKKLENISHRCKGQLSEGQNTNIVWKDGEIVFPTIEGCNTSGIRIVCCGITSEALRGSAKAQKDGSILRPDLSLIDDPQTDESARSHSQNRQRMKVINGTILEMAGPGKTMAAMMPCTCIEKGDMVDTCLDRNLNPHWRGHRTKALISEPVNQEAWDKYKEIYNEVLQMEEPDFSISNNYYLEHRTILDEGGIASWLERFKEDEVSAIQSAMHVKLKDPAVFYSEYQNDPQEEGESDYRISTKMVLESLNGLKKNESDDTHNIETVSVDLNDYALNWAYCCTSNKMSTQVADYGTYKGKNGAIWSEEFGITREEAFTTELTYLCKYLNSIYPNAAIGVDGNWETETAFAVVNQLIRKGFKVYIMRGRPHKLYKAPNAKRLIGVERDNCHLQKRDNETKEQQIVFNSHYWHMKTQQGIRITNGAPGSVSVWGNDPKIHKRFADHFCWDRLLGYFVKDGRITYDWSHGVGKFDTNDLFDAVSMCQVLANYLGAGFVEAGQRRKKKQKKRGRVVWTPPK